MTYTDSDFVCPGCDYCDGTICWHCGYIHDTDTPCPNDQ